MGGSDRLAAPAEYRPGGASRIIDIESEVVFPINHLERLLGFCDVPPRHLGRMTRKGRRLAPPGTSKKPKNRSWFSLKAGHLPCRCRRLNSPWMLPSALAAGAISCYPFVSISTL